MVQVYGASQYALRFLIDYPGMWSGFPKTPSIPVVQTEKTALNDSIKAALVSIVDRIDI